MTTVAQTALTRVRNDLCQKWRKSLLDSAAVEVRTPILHPYPDIAPVRQFTTVHPTTGEVAYLRIAPTEYLKRRIATGEERVFEFATNFRDDPADATHLPEFTSLEVMATGTSCADMERLTIDLCGLAVAVARHYWSPDALPAWVQQWETNGVRRLELADELREQFGLTPAWVEHRSMLEQVLADLGEPAEPDASLPLLMDRLVGILAQRTSGAVLIGGFPDYLGGPAAPHNSRLGFKQRSELFIDGLEVANMSSNLTDGRALYQWHTRGVDLKADLGIATNELDHDLLSALDGRLPPSAVLGIGVERMMLAALNLPDIRVFYVP